LTDIFFMGSFPRLWRAVFKARGETHGLDKFPVAKARGKHLFPFRTEQLSPSAPMVLGPQGPGRVGRRRSLRCRLGPPGGVLRGGSCVRTVPPPASLPGDPSRGRIDRRIPSLGLRSRFAQPPAPMCLDLAVRSLLTAPAGGGLSAVGRTANRRQAHLLAACDRAWPARHDGPAQGTAVRMRRAPRLGLHRLPVRTVVDGLEDTCERRLKAGAERARVRSPVGSRGEHAFVSLGGRPDGRCSAQAGTSRCPQIPLWSGEYGSGCVQRILRGW
jgi:hypothetical protein